jgi:transposase
LDVAANILYRWKEQLEKRKVGITMSEDERSELKSLRQEVTTLRVEKEILNKASACFTKAMTSSSTSSNVTTVNLQYALCATS